MTCLMKFKWVKLRRDYLPVGKGIMGYWARLASRVAFRKGKAFYCGHVNEIEVGEWVGGIMGLKSILGVSSKQKAFEIMNKLSELGYIEYELDSETRKLSYRILDYVFECSGRECDDNVYATNDFGFICVPRNITNRLIEKGYVFEESDAWLDLWIHTIFNDKKNFLTFFAPSVAFCDFLSFLSLEALSKRWGWEKTKTWRFFQKNKEVYKLIRLPGTYGCLIYNKLYPVNKEILIPTSEKIEEILLKTKTIFNEFGIDCKHSNLGILIQEYSELLIEKYFQEENSVALFNNIIRAYISPCWSFGNYLYDCKSISAFIKVKFKENKIRGPCELLGFSKKGEQMVKIKCKEGYNDSRESGLKEVGVAVEKVVKRAMENYRTSQYELNLLIEMLYKEYGLPNEISIDKLIEWEPIEKSLHAKVNTIRKLYVFLDALKKATDRLARYPKRGKEMHYIIVASYLDDKNMTIGEIGFNLGFSEKTYYHLKRQAFKLLTWTLCNTPIFLGSDTNVSFYELFEEVLYGKNSRY